jgi:Uncharacterized conserved protein (DUF2303)
MEKQDIEQAVVKATNDVTPLLGAGAALGVYRTNPARDGLPYVVVPESFKIATLPTEEAPKRPVATAKFFNAESLIQYVADHKIAQTAIYGNQDEQNFTCVFDDFHRVSAFPQAPQVTAHMQASFRGFRAHCSPRFSREFVIWKDKSAQEMKPAEFGNFLEANAPDVAEPDAATLMQIAYDFRVAQNGQIHSQQRMQDGSFNFQIAMENKQVGEASLPNKIKLSIPVFENTPKITIDAHLRFRAKDGIFIWYELIRQEALIDSEFKKIWDQIANATGLPILRGSPE